MPDKSLSIATYAAGASLAAITLVYVFAPTFFIDGGSNGPLNRRGARAVGLSNPANDCFINSVLQALAGLGDLRLFLIRETHRRSLDEPSVYSSIAPDKKNQPAWQAEGQQKGLVTQGLKDILDALNERPIYRKTISAAGFVRVLEVAFRQRISRQQQDAQEFLQVVAERLSDEYQAGHRARRQARVQELSGPLEAIEQSQESTAADDAKERIVKSVEAEPIDRPHHGEDGFPLEGKTASQIECRTCGFKPKPSESAFCTLTLHVPQVSSTSLNACFDGIFKTEYIDDFKCEKCRLIHAKESYELEMKNAAGADHEYQKILARLQAAIDTDPESPPRDVPLPDLKLAPRRKIARHFRITQFPKVLAIHLSRSIFDMAQLSSKNSAKVAFPELLPLGSILDQKQYKLLAVVCHKGNHHSGHYESFRRQSLNAPFSTPHPVLQSSVYQSSRTSTPASTPPITASQPADDATTISTPERSPLSISSSSLSSATTPPTAIKTPSSPTDSSSPSLRSLKPAARPTVARVPSSASAASAPPRQSSSADDAAPQPLPRRSANPPRPPTRRRAHPRKTPDRWWRISDEKVKESKTSEVLGMQREVYLLFYELVRE